MTDVRIICTYDAAKLAETLMRLLEAEQHSVRLTVGRQAMGELPEAREARDAVMLIWSPDARSQSYMIEWAQKIDPVRLVEIAFSPDPPKIGRKAPVIDFTNWRGERGERAQWNALNDRLRAVSRALNPPKPPPKYAAFALGMASAAAVTGAIVMRMNDTVAPAPLEASARDTLVAADPGTGLGGPLGAIEPASLSDDLIFARPLAFAPLRPAPELHLARLEEMTPIEWRDETFLERLSGLNPLRQPADDQNN